MLTLPYTFAGLPAPRRGKAGVEILPVAYDATTSWQPGARFGPSEIIMASRFIETYDEFCGRDPSEMIIRTLPEIWPSAGSPRKAQGEIRRSVSAILRRGSFPVILGGEHSITPAAVAAVAETCPDLSVLVLDAHSDLRPEYSGTRYSHACASRLCLEAGLPVSILGVRSLPPDDLSLSGSAGEGRDRLKLVPAHAMRERDWLGLVAGNLRKNVYLSIDLDFFDPSVMPAVGTPEPGGFDLPETSAFLRRLAKDHRVAGFDLVELNGSLRHAPSAYFAARLAWRMICLFTG